MAQKINTSQSGGWWEEVGRATAANSTQTSITATLTRSPRYLRILVAARPAAATAATFWITFNGDSGANYPRRQLVFDGATFTGTQYTDTQSGIVLSSTTAAFENMNAEIDVVQYSGASGRKEGRANSGSMNQQRIGTFQWSNSTSLINSVTLELRTAAINGLTEIVILGHD